VRSVEQQRNVKRGIVLHPSRGSHESVVLLTLDTIHDDDVFAAAPCRVSEMLSVAREQQIVNVVVRSVLRAIDDDKILAVALPDVS